MRHAPADPLLGLLGALGGLAGLCGFLRMAPNRLLSGEPMMLWQLQPTAIGVTVLLAWLALLVSAWWPRVPSRGRLWSTAVASSLLLLALPLAAGVAATHAMAASPAPLARVQLGAGFWLMLLPAGLLLSDRVRRLALPALASAAWISLMILMLALMAHGGAFDALAPMREYAMQSGPFHAALWRHLMLVAGAIALALLVGVPLALLAHRRGRFGRLLLGVLNLLQTVPSIALFALLIGPLAWLAQRSPWLSAWGVGGTGAAPALIALLLYALLPVVRSVLAGLDNVPAEALDAARGMGMRRGQMLRHVQLPLAWPVLLAGLRVVTIQSIGLAAVAALIGAGGLGHFIFLGLGQGANDLVLLGTMAIIALALAADALFHLLQRLTEPNA